MSHPTGYTAFVGALAGLTVSGVTKAYTSPPGQVNTASLPCSFPRLPSGDESPITGQSNGGWPTLRAELVILIEPWAQSTRPVNFAATLTAMDNVSAALRGADLAEGPARWSIEARLEYVGETPFWAVIATVTATG